MSKQDTWTHHDKLSVDEMCPHTKKKSWIHGLLKSVVYNTFDNTLSCLSHTTQGKWATSPDEIESPLLKRMWGVFERGVDKIDQYENKGTSMRTERAYRILSNTIGICATIFDKDPAWLKRLEIWESVYKGYKDDE